MAADEDGARQPARGGTAWEVRAGGWPDWASNGPLRLSYCCATVDFVAVRKKRSISIPPELDAEIAAAAEAAGLSYSAWVAETARKEFTIRAGLEAVSQYEAEHGPFTPAEIAQADEWATRITRPAGTRRTA